MSTLEVLRKARELVAAPEAWTQMTFARRYRTWIRQRGLKYDARQPVKVRQ